jgi:D-alanyl-D-alanine carboxypeptidase
LARVTAKALLLVGSMLGLLASSSLLAHAEVRGAAMVIDGNSGEVLHEQFADAPRHPASLTKIMTIFLAFREIEKGRLTFSTPIKISERAASVAPSKLDLDPGEEITLSDAIKALVTKSANDVAVAIAEHIGGTEAAFAGMMNDTAAEIGMRSTKFYNASGLPDNRQITTARDMLTLALRLQDEFPQHYRLFSVKSFDYRGKTYRTHNTLMHGFPGMDGIKTGYTKASGFNVVSSVHTNNKHVVAVVFGGATAAARNAHMRMILYSSLQKAKTEKTRRPNAVLVARRKTPAREQVDTGISAMPGDRETPPSDTIVAAAAEDDAEAVKANWQTETSNAPKPVAAPKPTAASKPKADPQPSRVQKDPKKDQIAAVIAKAQAAPTTRVVTTTVIKLPPASEETAPPLAAPQEPVVQASAAPPRLDLHALREAMTTPGEAQVQPGAATPRPSGIEALLASADGPSAPPANGDAPEVRNSPFASPAHAGETSAIDAPPRQPSTLGSQAEALAGGTSEPPRKTEIAFARAGAADIAPSRLQGPPLQPRFAAAPTGKGFEIQIGAYSSVEEAHARITSARQKATGLLDNHEHVAMAVQRGEKRIYRARFVNFTENSASGACLELRRIAIDCFVMKSE